VNYIRGSGGVDLEFDHGQYFRKAAPSPAPAGKIWKAEALQNEKNFLTWNYCVLIIVCRLTLDQASMGV
jgi:hypothetical protein